MQNKNMAINVSGRHNIEMPKPQGREEADLEIGPRTTARMPVLWWWSITIAIAMSGGGLLGMREGLNQLKAEVNEVKASKVSAADFTIVKGDVADLKKQWSETRELLVRIDENVKELKAERARSTRP